MAPFYKVMLKKLLKCNNIFAQCFFRFLTVHFLTNTLLLEKHPRGPQEDLLIA